MEKLISYKDNLIMGSIFTAIKALLAITFLYSFGSLYDISINIFFVKFVEIHEILVELKDIVSLITAIIILIVAILKIRKHIKKQ